MDDFYSEQKDDWKQKLKSASSDWKTRLSRERKFSRIATLEQALIRFSPGERLALYLLATLVFLSTLVLLYNINAEASVVVPVEGGSLSEGETGPARFINPVLAISEADQDLSALVYSGLTRAMPDGTYQADLASNYTISSDGRVYTFHLRPNATFQNGEKVTAADVLFTIQETQNPNLNSPHRADWTGVAVSSPDPETVVFTLPHAYAPFIRNTTLGILPKNLWQNTSDEEFPFSNLNTHPVGSGPYEISNVNTDSTGAAARYDLVPFGNYALGEAHLARITFVFYQSEDDMLSALNEGSIDAIAGLSPEKLSNVKRSNVNAVQVPLPRDFGVFFNQTHNTVLADSSVRAALDAAVDKQALIAKVLSGRGAALPGPIPPGIIGNVPPAEPQAFSHVLAASATSTTESSTFATTARALLQKGGWSQNASGHWTKGKQTLSFSLATADQPELVATANALAADWRAVGIDVSVQVYPLAQLNTNVIRPRSYDALLFGEVVGPELDLYAFWHSSQRTDPGLNLALYANSKTDALLSQARGMTDPDTRGALYQQFADSLMKDEPAIFLYVPDFLYIVPDNVHGIEIGSLAGASDRFGNVYQWYTDTEYVWSIFAPTSVPANNY